MARPLDAASDTRFQLVVGNEDEVCPPDLSDVPSRSGADVISDGLSSEAPAFRFDRRDPKIRGKHRLSASNSSRNALLLHGGRELKGKESIRRRQPKQSNPPPEESLLPSGFFVQVDFRSSGLIRDEFGRLAAFASVPVGSARAEDPDVNGSFGPSDGLAADRLEPTGFQPAIVRFSQQVARLTRADWVRA